MSGPQRSLTFVYNLVGRSTSVDAAVTRLTDESSRQLVERAPSAQRKPYFVHNYRRRGWKIVHER